MTQYEFLTIICGFLTAIVTLLGFYVTQNSTYSNVDRDRLEKLYSPLFQIVEPILFQIPIPDDFPEYLDKIKLLLNENFMLCDPSLLEVVEWLDSSAKNELGRNENFKRFCKRLNHQYDKLRKKLKLPVRSLFYRINKHQFESKGHERAAWLVIILRILAMGTVYLFISVVVFAAIIASLQLVLAKWI